MAHVSRLRAGSCISLTQLQLVKIRDPRRRRGYLNLNVRDLEPGCPRLEYTFWIILESDCFQLLGFQQTSQGILLLVCVIEVCPVNVSIHALRKIIHVFQILSRNLESIIDDLWLADVQGKEQEDSVAALEVLVEAEDVAAPFLTQFAIESGQGLKEAEGTELARLTDCLDLCDGFCVDFHGLLHDSLVVYEGGRVPEVAGYGQLSISPPSRDAEIMAYWYP